MILPDIQTNIPKKSTQQLNLSGINLTDNYVNGQMESCDNISADRYPYITTADELQIYDAGMAQGYQPVSMFAWEDLFVVSNEPSETSGYKCFYGGVYCGDAVNLDLPKQYAVVNSKLVMWPDKVYFNLYDNEMISHPLTTASLLFKTTSGKITYRKAAQ